MSSVRDFYNRASIKAAHAIAQSKPTIYLATTGMLASELEDYQMYEYNGLEFFPAYNQLWNTSTDGRFCRIVFQTHAGKPRWIVTSRLYAAGDES